MSESLHVGASSPPHNIFFLEEINSSPTIKFSLDPLGYTGCLKKSKYKGIANLLPKVFLTRFAPI